MRTKPNHHGRALGDSFLALGEGSRDAVGWLGRQFSGARRGGPVTQWALRAGISTHTAVYMEPSNFKWARNRLISVLPSSR